MSDLSPSSRKSPPSPAPGRFWVNHSRLYRAARHRDRDIIETELVADEGPLFPQMYENDTPKTPDTTEQGSAPGNRFSRLGQPRPVHLITGWEFVAQVREPAHRRFIPPDLAYIWRAIEFDFEYNPPSDSARMLLYSEGTLRVVPGQKATSDEWWFST